MICPHCQGPLLPTDRHHVCPRCRANAPEAMRTKRRKKPDPFATHEFWFTDDELAVRDEK